MIRYRRYLIALAIVLVLVGAYAAAGFLAVPHFLRKYAQGFVHDHYGRTLSIGEIHFNPFTLNLDMSHCSLPDADGRPMLAFEQLHVDLQLATLWRLGPSFGEIILTQPFAHVVVRPGGALNLADLGKGFPPPKPAAKKPSAPMRLYIGRLQVISGTATYEDRTRITPFRADFTPIAFELRDFSTRGTTGNGYGLSAASPQGERVNWSGTVHLAPLSSQGTFEVTGLKARTLWSYMRQSLPFEIDSGVIGLKGDYGLASHGGPMALVVNVRNTTLTSLGVKPAGGAQRYIDVARIELDDTRADLTQRSVSINKLTLAGGDIKVWLDERRRLNLLDLLGHAPAAGSTASPTAVDSAGSPPAPAAAPAPHPASGAPGGKAAAVAWKVSVPDIRATGFRLSVEDRSVTPAATLLLAPLDLRVRGYNTSPDDALDLTLDSGVNDAGKINGHAKVTVKSAAVSAHIETEDVPLTALQPYFSRYTSMALLSGTLNARLDADRQADGNLTVKCTTSIHELRTVDDALKQDFVKWKDLRIADISYRSKPQGLRVGAVTALEPYVRMIVEPDRSINIVRILKPSRATAEKRAAGTEPVSTSTGDAATAPDAPAAAPAKTAHKGDSRQRKAHVQSAPVPPGPMTPFPVSIGTVTLVNGSANYADLWIKPSFAIGIQSLGGTVKGLSSDPSSRATVDLKGKVDRYSPIQIGGQVNLLSAALYTDVKMGFQDLDLTVVNPYSGHFVGYKIAKGKLSVDVSYKIDNRQLTAAQHFVVDQLELGDRVESPDAVHVPLKIAVALLKDRNGVIDLNLPMSGSLNDPKFRIGPIIWKMFVNVITKAATAPFALLGHLFGGGEHMNVIQFDPGSAELDKPDKEQLAAVAKSLKERPQLKLEVPIVYSAELDREHVAAARLRSELLARELNTRQGKKHPDTAGEIALADPKQHFKLLVDQFQADLGKDAPLPPSAVAVQQAGRKETPSYDAAINDLNAALINHIQVTDDELQALGKQRAAAIEEVLVAQGQVDPGRVFIVNRTQPAAAAKPSTEGAAQTASSALPGPQTDGATNPPAGAPPPAKAVPAGEPPQNPAPQQQAAPPPANDKVKVELSLR